MGSVGVVRPSRAVRLASVVALGLGIGVPLAGAAVSSPSPEPARRLEMPGVERSAPALPEMPKPDLSALAPIRPTAETEAAAIEPIEPELAREPEEIDSLILEFSRRFAVEPALVKAVIHAESRFDPKARSRKGAIGLMQLMPRTARMYGVRRLTDPRENLRAGVQHLKKLLGRHEQLSHVIAAYNAGSPTVRRYRGIPPFRETRTYVTRVLRYRGLYLEDPLYAPVAAPAPVQRKPVVGAREDIGTRG